jgi:hypothetical protein
LATVFAATATTQSNDESSSPHQRVGMRAPPYAESESQTLSHSAVESSRQLSELGGQVESLRLMQRDAVSGRMQLPWVAWGREKLDWLRRFLPFRNGIASHDTFSRVFALLEIRMEGVLVRQ